MHLPDPVDLDNLLAPHTRRGIDLSLDRLSAALAAGDHPERRFPAVQVAGTNGKGSIATFLHAILQAAGLRTGVYRSPHLRSWCERIQLGDTWVDGETLRADLIRWLPLGERHGLTTFEVFTAAAMDRFARADLDLVVLEVGLGGRLDATTAHPDRRVVGFGPIGMDHRELLGNSLEAIAAEKAGAMGNGQVAISGPQPPAAAAVLHHQAQIQGCALRWVSPLPAEEDGGPALGCAGLFQRSNAAVAVGMAQALIEQGWTIPEGAIAQGLREARWPGRLERRAFQGRELLLDGAHNPPGAAALRRELNRMEESDPWQSNRGRRWLLAIQRTKEAPELLDALLKPQDQASIVSLSDADLPCWGVEDLLAARPGLRDRLRGVANPHEGLCWLRSSGALPVVAGSLHLLGEIWPLLDPAQQSPRAQTLNGSTSEKLFRSG